MVSATPEPSVDGWQPEALYAPPRAYPSTAECESAALSFDPVNSVRRALTLLRLLNIRRVSSIEALHRATRYPKPTIVRMMETLIAEGYVTRDKRQGGYLLTSLVQSLSCGFHGDPLVVEAARLFAATLTRRFEWPVSVALLDRTSVVVRYSTVSDSPISPTHATINMRLSLADRALGLAYMAYCSGQEREILFRMLATDSPGELERAGGRAVVETALERTRYQGFAERSPLVEPLNSSTVAVPILAGEGRVLATLGMGFFRRAVSRQQLVDEYIPAMQKAALAIVDQVAAMSAASARLTGELRC